MVKRILKRVPVVYNLLHEYRVVRKSCKSCFGPQSSLRNETIYALEFLIASAKVSATVGRWKARAIVLYCKSQNYSDTICCRYELQLPLFFRNKNKQIHVLIWMHRVGVKLYNNYFETSYTKNKPNHHGNHHPVWLTKNMTCCASCLWQPLRNPSIYSTLYDVYDWQLWVKI